MTAETKKQKQKNTLAYSVFSCWVYDKKQYILYDYKINYKIDYKVNWAIEADQQSWSFRLIWLTKVGSLVHKYSLVHLHSSIPNTPYAGDHLRFVVSAGS